jgi:HlyD family secretion protein
LGQYRKKSWSEKVYFCTSARYFHRNFLIMKQSPLILITILALVGLFSAGCGPSQPAAAAPPVDETFEAGQVAVPVEAAAVETGSIALLLNYSANLEAQKDVYLAPKVAGQVEKVLVKVGDPVTKGQPIAVLEHDLYAAQLKQAQGALGEAKLTLQKMEDGARPEELAAAQSALDIARAALKDAANIDDNERTTAAFNLANAQSALRLAQAEYDKIAWAGQVGQTPQALGLEHATNAYEASLAAYNLQTNPTDVQLAPLEGQLVQAQLQLALAQKPFRPVDFEIVRAKIQQAEGAVEQARLQLDYATIKAPLNGVVAELYIDEGDLVGNSTPLGRVVSTAVDVKLDIEESRFGQVFAGQNVSLRVAAHPGVDFPALVTNVAPVADAGTHTFKVTVAPLDKEGRLRPGMFADTTLLAQENHNTLLVPLTAVTTVNGQPTVYVVSPNGTVEQRTVTPGLSNQTRIEILSGVQAGEMVVITGQANLENGIQVKVVPEL